MYHHSGFGDLTETCPRDRRRGRSPTNAREVGAAAPTRTTPRRRRTSESEGPSGAADQRKYAVVPLPAPVSWAIDRVGLVADVTVALVSVQVPLPAVLLARPVVENTHVEECVSTAVMESRLQAVVDSWLMSAASAGVALVQAAGVGQLAVPAVPGMKPVQFVPPTIVTR